MTDETFESWYKTFIDPYMKGGPLMPEVKYITQRVCAKCGSLADLDNPLYPTQDGKFCRQCLPMKATITIGKTKLVITDRDQFNAYNRKEAWDLACYEVRIEERHRLDLYVLDAAMNSKNIRASERRYCRLCHGRITTFLNGLPVGNKVHTKYEYSGSGFRQKVWQVAQLDFNKDYLAREKRRYYVKTWGFNPYAEKIPLQVPNFKWEQFYPLVNDPAIAAAGVEIGARVEVSPSSNNAVFGQSYVKGRVVFRRVQSLYACYKKTPPCGKKYGDEECWNTFCPNAGKGWIARNDEERSVDCIHVAVMSGSLDTIPADQGETAKSGLDAPIVESVMSSEKNYSEVKLDPEEHYVALRSYVQGIAEVGLEAMFASRYPDDPLSLPFGFNTLMQKQVLHCLKELCPNAAKSILYKAVGYVLESAPDEWILARKALLNDTYGFETILTKIDFRQTQDEQRILILLSKLASPRQFRMTNPGVPIEQHLEWFIYTGPFPITVGMPVIRDGTTQVRSLRDGEEIIANLLGHITRFDEDRVEVAVIRNQTEQQFRRELEAPFIPDDFDLDHHLTPTPVPENVLRGTTAGTYEALQQDLARADRYLREIAAIVGMPVGTLQPIQVILFQLNDVQRAAEYVRQYFARQDFVPVRM